MSAPVSVRAAVTPRQLRSTSAPLRVISFKGSAVHHAAFRVVGGGRWLRGVLEEGIARGHIKLPK